MVTRNLRIDKPLLMVYVHVYIVYIDGPLTQQTQNICINICITTVQRLRSWSNIVQMLYKCLVFAGESGNLKRLVTPGY